MKIILILCLFLSIPVIAKDESAARELFEKYISSLSKKDLQGIISIMDPHFLEVNGGREHWKEVLKDYGDEYKGAKVIKVEFMEWSGKHYARFNFRKKNEKEKPLSDNWYLLKLVGDKFLIYEFLDHYTPGVAPGDDK